MKQINLFAAAIALIAMTFIFTACGDSDTFTDPRDGQKYKTVKIGDKVWMAEPLNYKKGAKTIWADYVEYSWDSALVACPEGWHLPDKSELESIANDSTFSETWSSTEKENLTSSAYMRNFPFSGNSSNKKDGHSVHCVQGIGIAQEYLNNVNGYKAIRIGKQIWMKENLNIPSPQSICYLNDDEECEKGRFYNLQEAKKICPQGWHLPTSNEAKKLVGKLNRLKNSELSDAVNQFYGSGSILGIYFSNEEKFEYDFSSAEPIGSFITSNGSAIRFYGKKDLEIDIVDDFIRSKSDAALVKMNVRCIADTEDKEE